MSSGNQPRTRSDLVAEVRLPPGRLAQLAGHLRQGTVLLRLLMCAVAALAMWGATQGWNPPLRVRAGHTPTRDLIARIDFSTNVQDYAETQRLKDRARAETVCIYRHDVKPLVELRQALRNRVFQITHGESYDKLSTDDKQAWAEFLDTPLQMDQEEIIQRFNKFGEALAADAELERFEQAVQVAFVDYERDGLLVQLDHELGEGDQAKIQVHPVGRPDYLHQVDVEQVRIAQAGANLADRLKNGFTAAEFAEDQVRVLAEYALNWINAKKLPSTLSLNPELTRDARAEAEQRVEPATINYQAGDRLAETGQPLTLLDIDQKLELEHAAVVASLNWSQHLRHSLADFGMYVAMYVLCGVYMFFHEPRLLTELRRLGTFLALVAITVAIAKFVSRDEWRGEIVPLVLFGVTVAIAYHRELALLTSTAVALVISLSTGQDLAEFVVLVASVASAVLLLGRIRSRTKLIYLGFGAGAVGLLTTVGVGTLMGQNYGWSGVGTVGDLMSHSFALRLATGAAWYGFCTVIAAVLLTGLLPFIERTFDVQTDISLLELGDAAHPLLQELVRRAPGTYNHSITVASISEAAAETIGAHGLLCRVGAYFHDIGKMLKPGYFIENQSEGGNRHDALVPAMSTLVIIAHVKDGADLARQHHLPQAIIDFIEQHHGTTLVEYFFDQATKQHEEDPDTAEVDETSFRYPGPKPQTKEAGVLMLADTCESACRTLVDPTPARIEHLVHELMMKRLLDGQFDECDLTLRELGIIEESLVKSLTAVYHGRVKYPDQQTA